jgi:predicted RND superfamily exporter protein
MSSPPRTYAVFEWINDHVFALSAAVVAAAVVLGFVAPLVADDTEPNFSPGGEIYDTQELVEDRFSTDSPVRGAAYLVEHPDGEDVLTAASLREIKDYSDALRADPEFQAHAIATTDFDLGVEIDGIYSIADAVDEALPFGLGPANDADVKRALDGLLADFAPTSGLRFSLSQLTDRDPGALGSEQIVIWRSPAFLANVRYDISTFDAALEAEGFGENSNSDAERWLREIQTTLRGDEVNVTAIGVAIDPLLLDEEQSSETAPYIFFAVAFILIVVGGLLRSYWAAMLAAVGLGAVMMAYNGINALIGLKTSSPLIIFVVPIALIAFGIDFFIHGSGRAREAQVEGASRERAYPLGMTAVFTALLLAAMTSVGAFLSNTASGIEAITQFGIAAAVAIALSYFVLGLIAPKQLLAIEAALGPRPAARGLHVGQKLGFLAAAVIGGLTVTLTIMMPAIGVFAYLVFLGLFLWLPFTMTRRRNRRAATSGKELTDVVKGAGHGFKAAGTVVHFLARWRVVTIPVVVALAVLGVVGASRVQTGFKIADFYSTKTDFIKSVNLFEDHFGTSASGSAYIYIEGDLTEPSTLAAMQGAIAEIDGSGVDLSRDFNGELVVTPNAVTIAQLATVSPTREAIAADSGVAVTDADGDGLPDTAEQVLAAYEYAVANGVPGDGDSLVFRPDQVAGFFYLDGNAQGTRLEVVVPSITDEPVVLATRDALDEAAAGLEANLQGVPIDVLRVSGSAITDQDTISSFTGSMLTSLPIAIVLTMIVVLLVLRSARFALISMVPILLVVAWLYGFMWWVDYEVNVVTATIAAIAVGVGIDYAVHFTVRFREEFAGEPSRFPALRRAGEGTGGALAISALTSITGFLVMAASPMPIFATFGMLTAVMIVFALVVSLLVLPSLLLLVVPSRKGEERELLEEAVTGGVGGYDPHSRDTALLGHKEGREGG